MLPAALTLRDIVIRPATVLAPMAGVTDTVFRRVIRGLGGCGLIMTEFTSAERVARNAARMVRETRCDAVMIGRAAATNPWIFRQIEQFAATGRYDQPSEAARYRLLSGYFRMLVDAGMPDAIGKMKQFACWFTHGVRNGSELRRQVHSARTPAEVLERVDAFFAHTVAAGGDP